MPTPRPLDRTDARILLALNDDPSATVLALAQRTQLSRNTVHARLARLEQSGALAPYEHRLDPAALGFPLLAYVSVRVTQRLLSQVAQSLAAIPEVVEVIGLSGAIDLLVKAVAADAEELYRVAGQILAIDGVERTETGLVMRRLVDYRLTPLLERLAASPAPPSPRSSTAGATQGS